MCIAFSSITTNGTCVEIKRNIFGLTCLDCIPFLCVVYASGFILHLSYLKRNAPLGFKWLLV